MITAIVIVIAILASAIISMAVAIRDLRRELEQARKVIGYWNRKAPKSELQKVQEFRREFLGEDTE